MAASTPVFIVQAVVSFIVLAFGITVWFTSSDGNLRSVGSGFVAYVLGFWTKGYKRPATQQTALDAPLDAPPDAPLSPV